MSKRARVTHAFGMLALLLLFGGFVAAQESQPAQDTQKENRSRKLELQFQSALAQYNAGHFPQALPQLEALLPQTPRSFGVHELLGLVYAALAQDDKATEQLQIAVQLEPESATARTNLAASLSHAGKLELAGEQFRRAVELAPKEYDANHNMGEYYVQSGKLADAVPFLEQAQQMNPSAYGNGYDLALAYLLTGRPDPARKVVQSLAQQQDTGELHSLLGEIEEKDGKFVAAANEYETAAHMDPSEENLFDWASELLLHRTYQPAIDVFQQAVQRYPDSPRLKIGLGMALYSQSRYDESIKSLLAAADLDPKDARCYLFLSKAYLASPNQAEDVIGRFRRYSELEPNNAMAQYYYAMSLWKGKRAEDFSPDLQAVESLLRKSIALDDKIADAHLQLGILYAEQHEYAKALPEYEHALELKPDLPDAHYRLGQYYVHAGEKDHAQEEFNLFQQFQAQHMAEVDKEKAEVQQFVYSAKTSASNKP